MSVGELLAIVGRSWVRLLLYPGGAGTLLALALLARHRPWREALLVGHRPLALAAPWLALALLPLPGAADLGYWPDCVVMLALLDLPWLAALAYDMGADRRRAGRSLANLLNGYPALMLGLLLCGGGTFDMRQMFAAPNAQPAATLHWLGAAAITCALPPLLGLGPFALPPRADGYALPLALRGVGYWCLGALPWLMPLDGQIWQALPPLGLALALWGFHTATRRAGPRPWAWGYLALDVALVCAMVAGAGYALAQRFQ